LERGELVSLVQDLKTAADPKKAKQSARFFKNGEGQYGQGDVFIGVSVPEQRRIAKNYYQLPLIEVEKLLKNPIHEVRLSASIILVEQFKRADEKKQKQIYDLYLANTKYINNWDIIDSSAPHVVGVYLWNNFAQKSSPSKETMRVLTKLARSKSIWDRRISILSTQYFIRQGDINETFIIADILLHDEQDLIHKAVGWMLREVGNSVGMDIEESFLKTRYKTMPRIMLRYAIEKFDESKRQAYLAGTV
jgi:3-methyladenine DNA glycosylase AlkD